MRSTTGFFSCIALIVFASCTTKNADRLAQQNDSLRVELHKAHLQISEFKKINSVLDSLHGLKKVAESQKNNGAPHEQIASKLVAINHHVIQSEHQIGRLHHDLKNSRHENSAYIMMVDALKGELQIRVDEVTILEGTIADVEQEKEELVIDKEKAVSELLLTVKEKQNVLTGLQDRLHTLQNDFRNTEAEAVYARAQAVEQSARKTRFAPAKKRLVLSEALELYKKARVLGKTEAEFNIRAIEKDATPGAGVTARAQ